MVVKAHWPVSDPYEVGGFHNIDFIVEEPSGDITTRAVPFPTMDDASEVIKFYRGPRLDSLEFEV